MRLRFALCKHHEVIEYSFASPFKIAYSIGIALLATVYLGEAQQRNYFVVSVRVWDLGAGSGLGLRNKLY